MPRPSPSSRAADASVAAIALALLVVYAPTWLRSPLRQGDLPGHLEAMRAYADWIWPAPWGWDPRFLLGAPLGILYPPAFHWIGGGLGKVIGVEPAFRLLVLASVALLPFAFHRAARGFGLRRDEAGWAAGASVAVLCLPGRGLGGSLHQTFVAGNAANAFALPILLLFLAELRAALGRPCRWRRAAVTLALTVMSHFLMGLVAAAALAAGAVAAGARRRRTRIARGARIAGIGAALAAPFLIPFLMHRADGSPDAIPFSPSPGLAEWGALAALVAALGIGGRRARRALGPCVAAVLLLYLLRGLVFPAFGGPPFRMEYHRFRLFLYLLLVPAGVLSIARIREPRWRGGLFALAGAVVPIVLLVALPYDARGPAPVPLPRGAPSLAGRRVLVLAAPEAQHGSWHGAQCAVPGALNVAAAKGLFVEASPASRAVFELERWASPPDRRPRWWAIRSDPDGTPPGGATARERLEELGIDAILTIEGISETAASALAAPPERLDGGWTLYRTGPPPPFPRNAERLEIDLDRTMPRGEATIAVNPFPDWRVVSGSADLTRKPGAIVVRGTGKVVLRVVPRTEEWVGLLTGLIAAAALALTSRRRPG